MIIVKNRELLIPDEERYIGTNYDTSSENRQFRVSRFAQNGVDLSALTFRLDLKYENASVDTLILDKETTDDYLVLTWEITKQQVQAPGTLWIQIRAVDSEATVRWSSFVGAMYVDRHLYTPQAYTGDLTEIEQIEQDHQYMLHVVDELKEHIDFQSADAEAWAKGTRQGTPVSSDDETYHDNSKYWSLVSQGWARGGTDTRPDEETDNSKYWSEVSHAYANQVSYKKIYTNVAEMVADTELVDGQVVRTLGYYAVNDGGGALYRIYATVPETYYETLANGLYAMLVMPHTVTPQMFGAYGDGTTDDATALNTAMASGRKVEFVSDYLAGSALTGQGVVCGNGNKLKISSSITVNTTFDLSDLTIESVNNSAAYHTITCMHATNVNLNNITIQNARQDGLYCNDSYVVAKNIRIEKARRNGISLISGYLDIDDFYIGEVAGEAPQLGIDIEPNLTTEVPRAIIRNGRILTTGNQYSVIVADPIREAYITIENVEANAFSFALPFVGYLNTKNIIMNGEGVTTVTLLNIVAYRPGISLSDPVAFCDIDAHFKNSNPSYYFCVFANACPFSLKLSAWFDVSIAQRTNCGLFRNFGSDATVENTIVYHSNFGKASLQNYGNRGNIISGAD